MIQALAWTLTSVAIVLTVGRFYIRYKKVHKLCAEDYLNGLALVTLIAFLSTLDAMFPTLLQEEDYGLGLTDAMPTDDQMTTANKLNFANVILFWLTIYSVKASFLMMYYAVFKVSPNFRKAWWATAVYICISFWATVLASLWNCGDPAKVFDVEACNTAPAQLFINIQAYWCALNVLGDLLLIGLPIAMLRNLHLRRAQKWGLAAIFSIVLVDILFDCLRTVYTIDATLSQYVVSIGTTCALKPAN